MPSSQIQQASNLEQPCTNVGGKLLPPPSKLPPPPPPPPKTARPPPPPPPPPPRISSQTVIQSANVINQPLLVNATSNMLIHNGSSVNSLNSIGRCSHVMSSNGVHHVHNSNQRSFMRHSECGSRSSMSSHGSQSHHHHANLSNAPNGSNLSTATCVHTPNLGGTWALAGSNLPHSHIGAIDTNLHTQDIRTQTHSQCNNCCLNHAAHQTNLNPVHHRIECTSIPDELNQPSHVTHTAELRQAPHQGCAHFNHHQVNCANLHHQGIATNAPHHQSMQQCCGNCLHAHNDVAHHGCPIGNQVTNNCNAGHAHHHHHCQSTVKSEPLVANTAHVHNLSNSSTTTFPPTHSSNAAIKQQSQYHHHRPLLSRGGHSSSSQQYEQYGISSAASTSSATASLSNYQAPTGYNMIPNFPANKINQPLPPPPSTHLSAPSPAPHAIQFISNHLPPLPPKPASPNASSCSTQITTVRTSPSLQNQPVTRVTSQAGVQNPLPNSDVPPPLPPLNPGLRTQPIIHTVSTRSQNMDYENERKTEALARQVEQELEEQQKAGDPLGICPKCCTKVMPSQEACKAMNKIFHATCFKCCECGRTLLGKTFYPVGELVYCEEDFKYTGHMQSLEKCAACFQPIFNMILPAMGKFYHPNCFKCCICGQCLDGVPFTIDRKDKIYCVKDYHNIYSPKCAFCGKSISPIDGTGETVRVVSMDKDYHIDCYCCEDCGLQLTDEEPSRSYPLDDHLYCQQCHINRLARKMPTLSLS